MQQANLKNIFNSYTGNKEMDGKTFAKLAKDCNLLDKKLTATDIDLIFAKVKTSSAVRTISYDQFKKGLAQMAEKKGITPEQIEAQVEQVGGPQFQGTKTDNVKFHDDKSQYTGMHAGKATGTQEESKTNVANQQQQQPAKTNVQPKQAVVASSQPAGSLQEVFNGFAAGASDMDGKTFAKLAKDCGLLDKKVTPTDIDLIFAKVKDKTARKITYAQFENALQQIADKKGQSKNDVVEQVKKTGGPKFAGTKTDNVKFHDDKSLYTGVYANGGPTNVDKDKINDIREICDRSGADVRGVKK